MTMARSSESFDRSRCVGDEVPDDLVRIAMTSSGCGAGGQFGLAESTIEWLVEKSLGSEEERMSSWRHCSRIRSTAGVAY